MAPYMELSSSNKVSSKVKWKNSHQGLARASEPTRSSSLSASNVYTPFTKLDATEVRWYGLVLLEKKEKLNYFKTPTSR